MYSKLALITTIYLSLSLTNTQAQTAPSTTTVNNITVNGDMVVEDVTITKDTLRAKEDIIAEHDVKVGGDLEVTGKIDFAGSGTTDISITYKAATLTKNYSILNFGPPLNSISSSAAATIDPSSLPACFSLNNSNGQFSLGTQPQNNIFSGLIRSYNLNGNQSSMLTMGNTGWGSSMIESEGNYQGSSTATGLMINYFCGRNTYINTGNANGGSAPGGWVYMGDQVSMRKHVEIGDPTWMISDANNVALDINAGGGKGIVFNTWNAGMPLISVANSNLSAFSPFTLFGEGNIDMKSSNSSKKMIVITDPSTNKEKVAIYADGRAFFGAQSIVSSHPHANAAFQVSGKIACKELVVVDPTKWADFVFQKDFKLKSLSEVERYYQEHKHLPDVPSEGDVLRNGINTAEMDAVLLQKIEELFLHLVSQGKKIEALEKENTELKQLLNRHK